MLNVMSYLSVLTMLVSVGDSTNLAVPAIAAGVGVGAIAVGLVARRRSKDDGKPVDTPPTRSRQSRHFK